MWLKSFINYLGRCRRDGSFCEDRLLIRRLCSLARRRGKKINSKQRSAPPLVTFYIDWRTNPLPSRTTHLIVLPICLGQRQTDNHIPTPQLIDSIIMSSTQLPAYFIESISVLTDSQKELCTKLYTEYGQEHLFHQDFFGASAPPSQRRQLAAHLEALDEEYIGGGLPAYIENARKLLSDSKNGVNPLEGWKPSVPKGQIFDIGTRQFKEAEAKGLEEIGSCGFVLVAGGLGERLGYSGIKVSALEIKNKRME